MSSFPPATHPIDVVEGWKALALSLSRRDSMGSVAARSFDLMSVVASENQGVGSVQLALQSLRTALLDVKVTDFAPTPFDGDSSARRLIYGLSESLFLTLHTVIDRETKRRQSEKIEGEVRSNTASLRSSSIDIGETKESRPVEDAASPVLAAPDPAAEQLFACVGETNAVVDRETGWASEVSEDEKVPATYLAPPTATAIIIETGHEIVFVDRSQQELGNLSGYEQDHGRSLEDSETAGSNGMIVDSPAADGGALAAVAVLTSNWAAAASLVAAAAADNGMPKGRPGRKRRSNNASGVAEDKAHTRPSCFLCTKVPRSIGGYFQHIYYAHHGTTLKKSGLCIQCGGGTPLRSHSIAKNHAHLCLFPTYSLQLDVGEY